MRKQKDVNWSTDFDPKTKTFKEVQYTLQSFLLDMIDESENVLRRSLKPNQLQLKQEPVSSSK